MMEFVRYSPRIEAPDPNFDTALQVVLDDLRKQVTASPRVEGQGLSRSPKDLQQLSEPEVFGGHAGLATRVLRLQRQNPGRGISG